MRRSVAVCALFALASCAKGAGSDTDGGAGVPDAESDVPDAGPDVPDGAPDVPDAVPPVPDAAWPDAAPVFDCGNGLVEPGEECDDGNVVETDGCRNSCAWAACGDGAIRTGVEECDDGNTVSGDGCSAICLLCNGGDARFTWSGNNHCYSRTEALIDWATASTSCPGRGHLVTYELAAENTAVESSLGGTGLNYWIGFADQLVEGSFGWVTGAPAVYTNWSPGEPNDSGGIEDCTEQYIGGVWNDLSCADTRGSYCEDEGWHIRPDDRHAYRFVFRPQTWASALADCAMLGGHLATITAAAEQSFVSSRATTNLWIGAGDAAVEGTFTWVTGDPFVYSAFAPGEPNDSPPGEDCVEIRGDTTWNDESCASPRGHVCEID